MGVCPQHDVLFENLSVHDHILFFSQLKGATLAAAQTDAGKALTVAVLYCTVLSSIINAVSSLYFVLSQGQFCLPQTLTRTWTIYLHSIKLKYWSHSIPFPLLPAELTVQFHLDERLDHLGHELSGGQRRKLSVAIAGEWLWYCSTSTWDEYY